MSAGELEETCILTGGDPFASGTKVKPGVLSVLGSVQKTPIPDAIEGRRKAFAEWVASSDNPLTSRAIVNRVWMWHFGQPLAGNPNNFGSTGKKPTHPELLDWLAAKFVESGWSFKALHRLIMTSEAYRRSAAGVADRLQHGLVLLKIRAHHVLVHDLQLVRGERLDGHRLDLGGGDCA
jgi:hypothetical protein